MTFNKITLLFIATMISSSFQMYSITGKEKISLIPLPDSVVYSTGNFVLNNGTQIFYNDKIVASDIRLFNDYLERNYGFRLQTKLSKEMQSGHVHVYHQPALAEDNYKLKIDTGNIIIEGGVNSGVFYALQTLIQLLPPFKTKEIEIPVVKIVDKPRFHYRGMHLDVVRHFFSVQDVKNYIDQLARYKMNYFHWHLTDDQGWRIEIKKYPGLHQTGAWRDATLIGHLFDSPARYDSIRYGGYYTREEIRDVVSYALERHITIIPEIEMPGHALAALASYPEFSCTGGPFKVGSRWGIYKDVFCPKEATFVFLYDVLNEVCELFPGKYIHIGGDECPKDRWRDCENCQKLIAKENLKDEEALQHYFTNRIASFLRTKNKVAIGWDEILNENLDIDAVIMSWRGYRGGNEGASKGHDVIMNPYDFCYFDSYESRDTEGKLAIGGYLPLSKVYNFEPVPDALPVGKIKHILGAQGNVWTEYITSVNRLNEMIYPRICALSEVLWTDSGKRNYADFTSRLKGHFIFLEFNKLNYSNALYDVLANVTADREKGVGIEFFAAYPQGKIYYTLSGTSPDQNAELYSRKFFVDQSVSIQAALFEDGYQRGKIFKRKISVNKATGRDVQLVHPPHPEYNVGGAASLVDGWTGNLPWIPEEWLGFLGTDLDATIDLGSIQRISRISLDVLKEEAGKIFLPRMVEVSISEDGIDYKKAAVIDSTRIVEMNRKLQVLFTPAQARWVRIVAKNANNKDWLFADELSID